MRKIRRFHEKFVGAKVPYYDAAAYYEIFINPSSKEMLEAADKFNMLRFIMDSSTKSFYAFSEELVHLEAAEEIYGSSRELESLEKAHKLILGSAELKVGKLNFVDSDWEHPTKKQKLMDWTWAERWINLETLGL